MSAKIEPGDAVVLHFRVDSTNLYVNGELRGYSPHPGAEVVPYLGPYVSDWIAWREKQGEWLWFG